MPSQKMRIKITVIVLLAIVAMFAGLFVGQHIHKKKDMSLFKGTWLEAPRAVSGFSLRDTEKSNFDNNSLKNRWTLLFFGFTSCPSICPTTMAEMGKMYKILESRGIKNLPQVVMISLDSARDSSQKLGQYVRAFNPNFIGARSEDTGQVNKLAQEMGIAHMKVGSNKEYTIEHSGTIMLINPKGELAAFFTSGHNAEQLADDYVLASS